MLKNFSEGEARHIADLAKTARRQRDQMVSEIAEGKFGEPKPGRGQHDPASTIGLEPLPSGHPARRALEAAIAGLSDKARWELQALIWIGRGDYGAAQWDDAISTASRAANSAAPTLADNADLHEQIAKGLYEIGAASSKSAAPHPT